MFIHWLVCKQIRDYKIILKVQNQDVPHSLVFWGTTEPSIIEAQQGYLALSYLFDPKVISSTNYL